MDSAALHLKQLQRRRSATQAQASVPVVNGGARPPLLLLLLLLLMMMMMMPLPMPMQPLPLLLPLQGLEDARKERKALGARVQEAESALQVLQALRQEEGQPQPQPQQQEQQQRLPTEEQERAVQTLLARQGVLEAALQQLEQQLSEGVGGQGQQGEALALVQQQQGQLSELWEHLQQVQDQLQHGQLSELSKQLKQVQDQLQHGQLTELSEQLQQVQDQLEILARQQQKVEVEVERQQEQLQQLLSLQQATEQQQQQRQEQHGQQLLALQQATEQQQQQQQQQQQLLALQQGVEQQQQQQQQASELLQHLQSQVEGRGAELEGLHAQVQRLAGDAEDLLQHKDQHAQQVGRQSPWRGQSVWWFVHQARCLQGACKAECAHLRCDCCRWDLGARHDATMALGWVPPQAVARRRSRVAYIFRC